MMPNMNPRQMAAIMRQMGIKNEEIKAHRVVIETVAGKKLIVDNPHVLQVDMHGDKSFQVSGTVREIGPQGSSADAIDEAAAEKIDGEIVEKEEPGKLAEHDIALVAEQAKVSKDRARKLLEETSGDIAQAIMKGENDKGGE